MLFSFGSSGGFASLFMQFAMNAALVPKHVISASAASCHSASGAGAPS